VGRIRRVAIAASRASHVPLVRRDCRCRHGRRWLCA
jgi:hypothetical protein